MKLSLCGGAFARVHQWIQRPLCSRTRHRRLSVRFMGREQVRKEQGALHCRRQVGQKGLTSHGYGMPGTLLTTELGQVPFTAKCLSPVLNDDRHAWVCGYETSEVKPCTGSKRELQGQWGVSLSLPTYLESLSHRCSLPIVRPSCRGFVCPERFLHMASGCCSGRRLG